MHGLPLRSAVIAKRRRRLRILAATAMLSLFGFLAGVTYEIWPHRAEVVADVTSAFTSPAPAASAPVAAPAPTRPVYRHSIVPGGAYTRREVADAMRKDAVVAAHYRDVDVEKVHTKTITAARAVYVSYRVGKQTYWTKNRVQLAPGETVLTDGDTEIRARCGNLVSDNARQPVAAEEPPLAALDDAMPELETGSSTITGERGDDEGRLTYVPFMAAAREGSSRFDGADPASGGPAPLDSPMWANGGSGSVSSYIGAGIGANGTSLVSPLGGGQRNNSSDNNGGGPNGGGPNGGGPNGGGPNGGGPNGGGPNGGGPNGGGPNGGGGDEKLPPPGDYPHTTIGESDTTGDGGGDNDGEVPSVPEPGTLMLLTLGACGFAARAARKRSRD